MATVDKSDLVRTRIEAKIKRDAESISKQLGVSQSGFVNLA